MTRDKAINEYIIPALKNTWNPKKCEEVLKALEQQPTTKNDLGVDWESYKDVDGNSLDDLILEVLQNNFDCGNTYGYKVADEIIGLLPSVTSQEPKTGHWIKVTNGRGGHECDICHEYTPSYKSGDEHLTKYCPNCGAKMVAQKSEEV